MVALKETAQTGNLDARKLGAVKGVESLLCFFLAFVALQRSTGNPQKRLDSWRSITNLTFKVREECRPFGHLYGFAKLLDGAVSSKIADMLHKLETPSDKEFREMRDMHERSRIFAVQSAELLSQNTLASLYPEAAKVSRTLPIGAFSDPLLVARMGVKFLQAYAARERVKWEQRLVDDKFDSRRDSSWLD